MSYHKYLYVFDILVSSSELCLCACNMFMTALLARSAIDRQLTTMRMKAVVMAPNSEQGRARVCVAFRKAVFDSHCLSNVVGSTVNVCRLRLHCIHGRTSLVLFPPTILLLRLRLVFPPISFHVVNNDMVQHYHLISCICFHLHIIRCVPVAVMDLASE